MPANFNHRDCLDSDRHQRPESRYRHGEYEQSHGSRIDGEEPDTNSFTIHNALPWPHDYTRMRRCNTQGAQLGKVAVRHLEFGWGSHRTGNVTHEGNDASWARLCFYCRILPVSPQRDTLFHAIRCY